MTESSRPRFRHALAAALLSLFGYVLVMSAWISDDAFIGLRSVVNLIEGRGFVWNLGERVQTFTAPLWTLSVAGVSALSGNPWMATLALAGTASMLAFSLLLWKVAPGNWPALVGGLALILSKAFTDFSTGGLENPFTHLFVVLGWLALTSGEPDDRATLWRFAVVAGLASANRLDSVLLFGPALLFLAWRVGLRRSVLPIVIGFLPVAAWLGFSVLYYGFPFPNTAYAKAFGLGIPRVDLLAQGLDYMDDSWQRDPITLSTILAGIVVALAVGGSRRRALAFGATLYVGYVLWIGGDYMSGRFLTAPFVVAVVLLASMRFADGRLHAVTGVLATGVIAVLGIGMVPCKPTVLTTTAYDECLPKLHGVTDERGYYYDKGLGLLSRHRRDPVADHANNPFQGRRVVMWNMMGYASFVAPRETHMIDLYGLGDPILARLPNEQKVVPGHYRRSIPVGYLRTLAEHENHIEDPALRAYWDKLHLVQAGPIWSGERLRAVLGFLLGDYDYLMADYLARRRPGFRRVDLAQVATPVPEGTPWYDERVTTFDYDGVRIALPAVTHARWATIVLDGNDTYAIAFVRAAEYDAPGYQVKADALTTATRDAPGMVAREVAVPDAIATAGFDTILILPGTGDNIFAIAGLALRDG